MYLIKLLFPLFIISHICSADDVLGRIASGLIKAPITQGTFQQTKHLKFLSKPLFSHGKFTYDQNQGALWKTLSPVPSLLLVNDAHLLTTEGEQTIPPFFSRVFKAIMGGDLKLLIEDFEITGKENKDVWQLRLMPRDDSLKKIISVIVLAGDTELRRLELHEVSGNLTEIHFSEISHPERLNEEQKSDFERLSP